MKPFSLITENKTGIFSVFFYYFETCTGTIILLFMRFLVFAQCLGLGVLLDLSIFNTDQPVSLKTEKVE